MTMLYARLDKIRWIVLCGALDERTGAGCGAILGLIILMTGERHLWLPPDRKPPERFRGDPSEQIWEVSKRAVRQLRLGYPALGSRRKIEVLKQEGEMRRLPRGNPVGQCPFLPVRIQCRCGQVQQLDADRLEVKNPLWTTMKKGRCAAPDCTNRAWPTTFSGRWGYCVDHVSPRTVGSGGRFLAGNPCLLDSAEDLRHWVKYTTSIS